MSRDASTRPIGRRLTPAVILALLAGTAVAPSLCLGQQQDNPVYVNDSPTAEQTISRAREHVAGRNTDEAVRILQHLLDEDPDRVIASGADPDLFLSVRSQVHDMILGSAELLARYRAAEGERARALLDKGDVDAVERTRLLTAAGLDATLRLAHRQVLNASFHGARRTLDQLERHPDRLYDPTRRRAAALGYAEVARYIDEASVRQRAEAWLKDAGEQEVSPLLQTITWPEAARRRGLNPLDPAAELGVEAFLAKPFWSAVMTHGLPPAAADQQDIRRDELPTFARDLWVFPTVAGDLLITNNGVSISAWDRFTLSRVWSVSPGGLVDQGDGLNADDNALAIFNNRGMYGGGAPIDEPSIVKVAGRTLVTVTGVPINGARQGDARLHAIDLATGRVRWSVLPSQLDPLLDQSYIRGPVVVGESVAIVTARKITPDRRVISLYVVALDLADGRILWKHLAASTGSMPWNRQNIASDSAVVADGIVYISDRLGAIAAYEAASGRPLWIRRVETPTSGQNEVVVPWALDAPIVDGDSLVLVSPDRRDILRLRRSDGAILAQAGAGRFVQSPLQYITRAGDSLIVVGSSTIASVPIDNFETAEARASEPLPDPGIRGRVCAVGSRLLVPTTTGALVYAAADPAQPPLVMALDSPGNILALGTQLVVTDDFRIHSYLLWDEAERILSDRMSTDPDDPMPAITFAELAYRAGRDARILPAVDSALKAINAAPQSEALVAVKTRLYDALHTMIRATQDPEPRNAALDSVPAPRLADASIVGELVDRLGRVAVTPDQRAGALLSHARWCEETGKSADALVAYQTVLTDETLAGASWTSARMSVRADLDAARRISELVMKEGPAIYSTFSAAADAEADALPPEAAAADLERIAHRFPMSPRTPALFLRAADLRGEAGANSTYEGALSAGLDAALRLPNPDPTVLGELGGRLVDHYRQRELPSACRRILTRVGAVAPEIPLTAHGQVVDATSLVAEIDAHLATERMYPPIGAVQDRGLQVVQNWTLMRPVLSDRPGGPPNYLIMESENGISVWTPPSAPQGRADADMQQSWSRPHGEGDDYLICADKTGPVFLTMTRLGAIIERVSLSTDPQDQGRMSAATTWRTPAFDTVFADEGAAPPRPFVKTDRQGGKPGVLPDEFIESPLDGTSMRRDVLVCRDEGILVLVRRSGHAAAIDMKSGEIRWARALPIERVYDCDVSGGILALAGDREVRDRTGVVLSLRPTVAVVDVFNGLDQQAVLPDQGRIRWVRIAPDSSLIVGAETAIIGSDIRQGIANWVVTDWHIKASRACWTMGDTAFILTADRSLHTLAISSGRMSPEALLIPREHLDGVLPMDMSATDAGSLAVRSPQGLILLSQTGEVRGIDSLGGFESLLSPAPCSGGFVTIETIESDRRSDGLLAFNMHRFDNRSAMLIETRTSVLGASPRDLAIIDGRIAVSAGSSTVIYQAPPAAALPAPPR